MTQAIDLPETLEEAHALIRKQTAQIEEQQSFIHELRSENADLRHRLDQHARRLFGKRSEQLDADQLRLAFAALNAAETTETDAADEIEVPAHTRRKKGHGRTRFSAAIPREQRVIAPDDTSCPGCRQAMVRIGEEKSEQLDYVPATLKVIETIRPKYACSACKQGVHVALAPQGPIPKGKATAGMLAHVAVSKYVDHLPLHRQVSMLRRQGVELSKQTLGGWIRQVSALLEPIARAMWRSILSSRVLLADETPVKVLVPGRREAKRAYLWAFLGDQDEVAFEFSMGRGSEVPLTVLEGYAGGTLLADAYAGYDRVVRERPTLERAGCWAHARRYFFEARDLDPERALPVLALIRELYAVEAEINAAADGKEARVALASLVRAERSRPILARLEERLRTWHDQVLPKSPIGKAVGYALGQWAELTRFVRNGRIPIDNNAAERQLRTVAVGRNNWTFCGSEAGGTWAATFYGLLGTCKLQGIDPLAWLRHVLECLGQSPEAAPEELTPRAWAQAHANGVAR